MSYRALVSFNLPSITNEQRESFCEYLKSKRWYKLSTMTNTWKVSLKDGLIDRVAAIKIIEKEIFEAKKVCNCLTVNYAIQLDKAEVIVKTI